MAPQTRDQTHGFDLGRRDFIATAASGLLAAGGAGFFAEPASAARVGHFEGRFLRPIDVGRAARDQYGSAARARLVGQRLFDWRAEAGGRLLPLDMRRAVARQFGGGWSLVAVGAHAYDWKAVRFSDLRYRVLPVMPVAADRMGDIAGVRRGLARMRSVLARVQLWYRRRSGVTFGLLQPLIVPSRHSSAGWNAICRRTLDNRHRFALYHEAVAAYRRDLPPPHAGLKVVIAPYSGESADVWQGAASTPRFAVVPAYGTSLACPLRGPLDDRLQGVCYAYGHEMGHQLGLGHPCDARPRHPACGRSIMQSAKPPGAILLPAEVAKLRRSRFFSR